MFLVGDLKKELEKFDDKLPVVFEWIEGGKPADTSYGIDKAVERHGFAILQSVD